jgi:hypothetical protein
MTLGPRAVVLTNFRFGQMDDFYGLGASTQHWPHEGVMVDVLDDGPDATPRFGRALRVERADFRGFEGARFPVAERAARSNGRVLDAYVEIRSVTPATIAAANRVLAGVHTCQAQLLAATGE